MTIEHTIEERFLTYPPAEYQRWCTGDRATIDRILARSGEMWKSRDAYYRQSIDRQYYYEAVLGAHLVECEGFARDKLVFENYVLSAQARPGPGAKLKGPGTEIVRSVFSEPFFERFDELYSKNTDQLTKSREMHVDLFAVNPRQKTCGFFEVKSYNPEARATEQLDIDQKLLLAFVRYLADHEPKRVLREPGWQVRTEVVVFIPRSQSAMSHRVAFEV